MFGRLRHIERFFETIPAGAKVPGLGAAFMALTMWQGEYTDAYFAQPAPDPGPPPEPDRLSEEELAATTERWAESAFGGLDERSRSEVEEQAGRGAVEHALDEFAHHRAHHVLAGLRRKFTLSPDELGQNGTEAMTQALLKAVRDAGMVRRVAIQSCPRASSQRSRGHTVVASSDTFIVWLLPSSVKCSTTGGWAKKGPTIARHCVNSGPPRKPTVWSSSVSQKICST